MENSITRAYNTVRIICVARNNGLVLEDTVINCKEIETGREGICGIDLVSKSYEIGVFFKGTNLSGTPATFTEDEFNNKFTVLSIGVGF